MDLVRGQVLEPRSCGVSKVKGKVADDDRVISRAAQLARQAVVVEPETGIRLPRVLGECGGLPKAWGKGAARISRLNTRVPGCSGDGLLSSLQS